MFLCSKDHVEVSPQSNNTSKLISHIQRKLHIYIIKTYNTTPYVYKQQITFHLLHNSPTHLVSIFKEHMINDYIEEFLKREYTLQESTDRLPKFARFYKNYLQFFCKATLRHFRLNDIIKTYGEEKAENYYKENYQDTNDDNDNHSNNNKHNNDDDESKNIYINNKNASKCGNDSDTDDDDVINSKSTIFSNSVKKMINKEEDNNESFFSDINKAMQFPISQRYLKSFEQINIETLNGKLWNTNVNNITKHSNNNTILNLLSNLKLKQQVINECKKKVHANVGQIVEGKIHKKNITSKQNVQCSKNGINFDKHKNVMSYTNIKNLIKYNTLFDINNLRYRKRYQQIGSFKKILQHHKGDSVKMKTNTNNDNDNNNNRKQSKSRNKIIDNNNNISNNHHNTNSLTKRKSVNNPFRTVDFYLQCPKLTNKITIIKAPHKSNQYHHHHKVSSSPNNIINNNNIVHIHPILSFSNNISTRKTRTESSLGKNYIPIKIGPKVKPLSSIRKNIPYGTRTIISSPKSLKSNSNSSRNINTDKANLMKIALSVLLDGNKSRNQQNLKTSSLNINIKHSLNHNKSRNSNRSNNGLEIFLKSNNYNYHTHNKSVSNFILRKNISLKKKGYDIKKVLPKSKERKK